MDIINEIKNFMPKHKYFIGVDSDGSAFDSMEIKHKKVFIPIAIEIWNLKDIEKEYIEISEYINLYSNLRGINRFTGLLMGFEYIEERLKTKDAGKLLPDYSELKNFIEAKLPLSNASLIEYAEYRNSKFLQEVIEWSLRSDKLFSELASGLPPFKFVKECLDRVSSEVDTMVISAASTAGLYKDWEEGGILKYMSLIAGQEIGGKKLQLEYGTKGKYEINHVLMIGDAPGDMKAARDNNALFYPIIPGREEESWERFLKEAYNKFISNDYAGEYEERLVNEFLFILSKEKPWL